MILALALRLPPFQPGVLLTILGVGNKTFPEHVVLLMNVTYAVESTSEQYRLWLIYKNFQCVW